MSKVDVSNVVLTDLSDDELAILRNRCAAVRNEREAAEEEKAEKERAAKMKGDKRISKLKERIANFVRDNAKQTFSHTIPITLTVTVNSGVGSVADMKTDLTWGDVPNWKREVKATVNVKGGGIPKSFEKRIAQDFKYQVESACDEILNLVPGAVKAKDKFERQAVDIADAVQEVRDEYEVGHI